MSRGTSIHCAAILLPPTGIGKFVSIDISAVLDAIKHLKIIVLHSDSTFVLKAGIFFDHNIALFPQLNMIK